MLKLFGWNTFVAHQPEELRPAAAQFQNIFNTVGLSAAAGTLIVLALISVVVFYFLWSKGSSPRIKYRYRIGWWFVFIFVTALVIGLLTTFVMKLFMNNAHFATDAYMAVSICNFLYSLIVFFLGSLFVSKVFSRYTNASCTPF